MPDQSPEPATLRDVYELVDTARKETTTQIGDLASKLGDFVRSNEHRMTIVETHQATQAKQLTEVVTRLDEHGKDIGVLKDQRIAADAVRKEKVSVWTHRHSLIAILSSVSLTTVTLVALLLTR